MDKQETLYQKIAGIFEQQIASNVLKVGNKLPSIRTIRDLYGVSVNTAKQALWELERKGLIEARPKSGYYVSKYLTTKLPVPAVSSPKASESEAPADDRLPGSLAPLVTSRSRSFRWAFWMRPCCLLPN